MKLLITSIFILVNISLFAQPTNKLRNKDRKSDVLIYTTFGNMLVRLYDSTPIHKDNFLRLVKSHYYDSLLFHRVIHHFMIQSGDPDSKHAISHLPLGNGGPKYTLPAEIRSTYFHHKGVLAAARMGDDVNPLKASSGSQFYIVQGKIFTDKGLDSLETYRLNGRKINLNQRLVYETIGGSPHLDQNYTIFGELIDGFDVLDKIAATETSKESDRDRPIADIRIIKTKLIKRSKHK